MIITELDIKATTQQEVMNGTTRCLTVVESEFPQAFLEKRGLFEEFARSIFLHGYPPKHSEMEDAYCVYSGMTDEQVGNFVIAHLVSTVYDSETRIKGVAYLLFQLFRAKE